MQLNFKLGLGRKAATQAQLVPMLGSFWHKIYKTVFFVFLLTSIALGGYVWRQSLLGAEWSDEKKQEYLTSQNKGVIFKEADFKKALLDVKTREQENTEEITVLKDVFKAY